MLGRRKGGGVEAAVVTSVIWRAPRAASTPFASREAHAVRPGGENYAGERKSCRSGDWRAPAVSARNGRPETAGRPLTAGGAFLDIIHLLTAALLGILQGLTEFLPVSSTAHLLIGERLLGFDDPGGVFTVMIQLGSILAVMWLYRQRIIDVIAGLADQARGAALCADAVSRVPAGRRSSGSSPTIS